MLKRDRTFQEKHEDAILKTAVMRLGPNPTAQDEPTPYPYTLAWDRAGRKGQRCRVVKTTLKICLLEFEDGHQMAINRMAVRRS